MELECSNLDWVMWVATFSQVGDGDGNGRRVTATARAKGDGDDEGLRRRRRGREQEEEGGGGGDDNGEKRGCWWEVGERLVGGWCKWISN